MAVTPLAAVLSASRPASRMKTAASWLFVLPLFTEGVALNAVKIQLARLAVLAFRNYRQRSATPPAGGAADQPDVRGAGPDSDRLPGVRVVADQHRRAGVVDTTNSTAGTRPEIKGAASCGGGASVVTAAQSSADAVYGGGGFYRGGRGASLNGNNSGAGGNGGPGFALIIIHFA